MVSLQVKLSVVTSSKLPAQLQSIKRKLGLTLIKFEDASVDLKPFVKNHSFESSKFFLHSILKHYKDVSNTPIMNNFPYLPLWQHRTLRGSLLSGWCYWNCCNMKYIWNLKPKNQQCSQQKIKHCTLKSHRIVCKHLGNLSKLSYVW